MQLLVLLPPLEQTPDQITSRPFGLLSVIRVPTGKLAAPGVPTETLSPTGEETIRSPLRPVAVSVSVAAPVGPPPQTLATPPPPQVCGAVQEPQVCVPPQPSAMVPQFVPCAAQVVGLQVAVVKKSAFCCETPPEAAVITTED